jgi:glycosyltransferase involved in cell wall biosynthesis
MCFEQVTSYSWRGGRDNTALIRMADPAVAVRARGLASSVCAIVPALDSASTIGEVVRELVTLWPSQNGVIVVDDGSTDATSRIARDAGAIVLRHPHNRGKGAALRTGMARAKALGFDVAVTVDADGQHPPKEALRLLRASGDPSALVLGIRDLPGAGAPRANQISNAISNFFLSAFSGRRLADTQCGLRRYPIATTLALGAAADGYAFEAEVLLRAIAAGVRVVEVPIQVVYPPPSERVTHFDSVRDPARIVVRVLAALADTRLRRRTDVVAAPAGAGRTERASQPSHAPPPPP